MDTNLCAAHSLGGDAIGKYGLGVDILELAVFEIYGVARNRE